jgi:hypothetical protein
LETDEPKKKKEKPMATVTLDFRTVRLQELGAEIRSLSVAISDVDARQRDFATRNMVFISGTGSCFKADTITARAKFEEQLNEFRLERNALQNRMNAALRENAELKK